MDKKLIANVWHSGLARLHPVIIRPSGENENCIINDQLPIRAGWTLPPWCEPPRCVSPRKGREKEDRLSNEGLLEQRPS